MNEYFVITVSTLPPSKSSSHGIHVAESEINTKNPKFKSPLKRFKANYSLTIQSVKFKNTDLR
jgi:hypothetical protein